LAVLCQSNISDLDWPRVAQAIAKHNPQHPFNPQHPYNLLFLMLASLDS